HDAVMGVVLRCHCEPPIHRISRARIEVKEWRTREVRRRPPPGARVDRSRPGLIHPLLELILAARIRLEHTDNRPERYPLQPTTCGTVAVRPTSFTKRDSLRQAPIYMEKCFCR